MSYVLGLDQGGTKTVAVIIDSQGRICGTGKGPGAYYPSDGMDYAMETVRDVAQKAEREAGIQSKDVELAVVGITGMDFPSQKDNLKAALAKSLQIDSIDVVNDCIIAMYGGTKQNYGAVICAGTGLNIAIKSPDSREFIFGFYLDDNVQGGGSLARRAIRKVFDEELGLCEPTELTAAFLNYFHKKTVDELLYVSVTDPDFYSASRFLVPQIVDIAADGDTVTKGLLCQMAKEMADYLVSGLKKYEMLKVSMDIVLTGSVFKGQGNLLTRYLSEYIIESAPNASIVDAKYEPVVGACRMALQQLRTITDQADKNLEQTAALYHLIRTV